MALLIECPKCKHRNSEGVSACKKCEYARLKKDNAKVYWVDFFYQGKRLRERVGPSRAAAEARQVELRKAAVDGVYIQKDKNAVVTLGKVFNWFLSLQAVQALDSYSRFQQHIKALERLLDTQQLVRDLSVAQLENYVQQRLKEPSPSRKGKTIAPKTVKEELNTLRNLLNRAFHHELISKIPIRRFPTIKVDNVRKKILEQGEYQRLLDACPLWMRCIVIMARGTGMRQGEIVGLCWSQVDLKEGFVRLKASDTKTDEARSVRLLAEVLGMLRGLPRPIHTDRVFLSASGQPISKWDGRCNKAWKTALSKAGIEDMTFHDLRHDFVTRAMRSGNASHVVMKQVGHKTDSMLRRYQLVDERDLLTLQLDDSEKDAAKKRVF